MLQKHLLTQTRIIFLWCRRLDGGRLPRLIGGVGKVGGEPEEEEARARRRAAQLIGGLGEARGLQLATDGGQTATVREMRRLGRPASRSSCRARDRRRRAAACAGRGIARARGGRGIAGGGKELVQDAGSPPAAAARGGRGIAGEQQLVHSANEQERVEDPGR
jgi:hypothetical protein